MPVRIQRLITFLSVGLFILKIIAWYLTNSVAILTDALESTVNIITAFLGLFSVRLAAKPRDRNHPFGHGKIEFISAAIEGALIIIAGLMIIYEAIDQLIDPASIRALNLGLAITAFAGIISFVASSYAIREGRKHRSATVEAAGRHLRTDAVSSFAILAGLLLLLLTGWQWLDSAVAIVFAVYIILTGYRVVRRSLAGIMDETDETRIAGVISFLQAHRRPQWIDLHNLRVIQFGEVMHMDAHVTLPWYYLVADAEKEIHALEDLIRERYGGKVEVFLHIDACAPYSCKLCALNDCPVRRDVFREQLVWDLENAWVDAKHGKPLLHPGQL